MKVWKIILVVGSIIGIMLGIYSIVKDIISF